MNTTYSITKKEKNKHLSADQIEFIVMQVSKHDAVHKGKVRNTGRTTLIKELASTVNTSPSNIYDILKNAKVILKDSELRTYQELSPQAAINRRKKTNKTSNICKLEKAASFIELVISKVDKMNSVDEVINSLKLHHPEAIDGMETICTKTMYNYIHQGKVSLKPIDMIRMVGRRVKNKDKLPLTRRQKGTPITERPTHVENREEFGHWEGDLVTGPRDGKSGAYLTLLERKTRFYYMIPIKSKSSKNVYMAINKLDKFYGADFSTIFKSITFDNGNEFARHKDIEKKPGCKIQRTSVYFATPYCSYQRGSNENCNSLIRRYIRKGTDINTIAKEKTLAINTAINSKCRKILGYLPAHDIFIQELNHINEMDNKIYYEQFNAS